MDAAMQIHQRAKDAAAEKTGIRRTLDALTSLRNGFSSSGRKLLQHVLPFWEQDHVTESGPSEKTLGDLSAALLSVRGEASGVAIATDLLALYEHLDLPSKQRFFETLATEFDPDHSALTLCWERYRSEGAVALPNLFEAVEAPRQELFRRLNLAPGGTAALVGMRADLLSVMGNNASLERVEYDLKHLLQSWFNRGFLTMQNIDWSSPAKLLERLIQYESVHDINSWSELRLRLDPPDRRCFAFFHPALPDEPLIFVEVGLTVEMPDNVQQILSAGRAPIAAASAQTATFYSINNCQAGLKGISFGHFLIKQVAADLKRELPNLNCFVTLSPIPGLISWMRKNAGSVEEQAAIDELTTARLTGDGDDTQARSFLLKNAVAYFTTARNKAGKPWDPVARFHLGNGARLERLNWRADTSANGLRQSGGLMVNYLYDLSRLEENHEAFFERGEVVTGVPFRKQIRATATEAKQG
ncbi:malonyl-CoA decarboxylase [Novosphingobium sp.]|uniref:malonyl-CoA decarboxylase n=1 Tax=Novosphingobium sp. TaxID=1874826 RepID=UPI0035695E1A